MSQTLRSLTTTKVLWAAATAAGLCICLGGTNAPPASAGANVGCVMDMVGNWKLQGSAQFLAMGQKLSGGSVLVNENPQDRDYIIVGNLNGDVIKEVRCQHGVCAECRVGGGCYDPVQPLPAAPSPPSAFSEAWNGLLELFGAKPDQYSMHRVRGQPFELKRDGVLALHGAAMDAAPILLEQESGTYEFRCVEINRNSRGSALPWTSKTVALNWSPGQRADLAFDGLREGLFLLRAKHEDDSSSAWIFVVSAAEYPEWVARFDEVVRKTSSWGDVVSPDVKRSYQRAYLEYLSNLRAEKAK